MTKVGNLLRSKAVSAEEIALRARLPSERVKSIIEGQEATLAELRALARALKIPLRAFAKDPQQESEISLLFRSNSAGRVDLGVEKAASFVEAAISILPPRSSTPSWLSQFEFGEESYQEAERLAYKFRSLFVPDRLDDPLHDLPEILVSMGGVVLSRLDTSRFEGASAVVDGYAFIFVSPRFSGRMLFTLAHELGHLIAHHGSERVVVFDLPSQVGASRKYRSKSEAFVDAFASVLLLPERGVGLALKQIRKSFHIDDANQIGDAEILCLARLYGVSFEVAALRCENLELLPPGGAWSLAEFLRKEYGSPEKRGDALGLPKRRTISIPRASNNLLKAAAEKIERGQISLGWVTDRLGCSANDLYSARSALEANRGSSH